jgi:hypothetical protein
MDNRSIRLSLLNIIEEEAQAFLLSIPVSDVLKKFGR